MNSSHSKPFICERFGAGTADIHQTWTREDLRDIFFFSRSYFPISAGYFSPSAQKKFITNFVTCITNFVICVTNFLTSVTNFVTKYFCADSENFQGLRKKYIGLREKYLQGKAGRQAGRRKGIELRYRNYAYQCLHKHTAYALFALKIAHTQKKT